MAIEKQLEYSHTDDELCSLVFQTFKLGSPSSIIIIDDEEDETLEPKKKKKRLGSWWDDVDALNELSCVVKGLPKSKENERSLSSSHHENLLESYSDSNNKENQGYGHVSLEDLVEGPWLAGYVKDIISPVDSCSSSFTHLLETETNTNKERSLSSSYHDDNFIEDEIVVGESTNRGNRHVSLEELGVSGEHLKSMPWEAFDPTWEIRSETMDPWLGGYIKDSAH